MKLGEAYKQKGNKLKSIENYGKCFRLMQGKIDKDAYRVEQREVGFSDKEKIGTDNLQQCIAIIVHDPKTKKTALAHFDRGTDPQSISEDVIDKFPRGNKLDLYLVGGGRNGPGFSHPDDQYHMQTAKSNRRNLKT
jgi:hypothetical protein